MFNILLVSESSTTKQYEQALQAQKLYHNLGTPAMGNFRNKIKANWLTRIFIHGRDKLDLWKLIIGF